MNLLQKLLNRLRRRHPCGAVIVAAGSGSRMGGVDKIMTELAGRPVIVHTIAAFEACDAIQEIVLVGREAQLERLRALMEQNGFQKVKRIVPGGETRMDSVQNGLAALSGGIELAAVQDGARPLVTPELIRRVVDRAVLCRAAAPAVPVKDTIKTVDGRGVVTGTPERDALRAVQTPQVFDRDLLAAAWKRVQKSGKSCTDDCAAMELLGVPVYLVEGDEENIKLTTPPDLRLAERILEGRGT